MLVVIAAMAVAATGNAQDKLEPNDEARHDFESSCAVCHGAEGHGDGPMAKSLNPPPFDLSATLSMPIAQDDFLYWTIAAGGAPVGSATRRRRWRASRSGTRCPRARRC